MKNKKETTTCRQQQMTNLLVALFDMSTPLSEDHGVRKIDCRIVQASHQTIGRQAGFDRW
ncbi:MAG: hypothetical protein GYB66_07810 [Chloroflexi bacterium]|nr:hypothetical protein [Chloroflexota bacterium]